MAGLAEKQYIPIDRVRRKRILKQTKRRDTNKWKHIKRCHPKCKNRIKRDN